MTEHPERVPRTVLSGKSQFDRVFAAGQRAGSRYFRVHYADGGAGLARLGMAVSRKVDKRAVNRNRLRRQIRESFRRNRSELPVLDLVVTARPEAAGAAREQVWQDLSKLWSRLPR